MPERLLPVLHGLGLYLLLCAATWLAGRGLARLLRLRLDPRALAALCPVLTLLLWVLVFGATGGCRVPIRLVAPWLWGATALLALAGLWEGRSLLQRSTLLVAFCALVPLFSLGQYFAGGLLDSNRPLPQDGYCYLITAQYQWEYGRHLPDDCSYIHGMGAMYLTSRYTSFSLLAFLTCLTSPGEVDAIGGLYQAWILFVFASGVLFFWVSRPQVNLGLSLVATFLSASGGWIAIMLWANNMDHQVAMVWMPVLAAVVRLWEPNECRRWLLAGAILAAAIFTYAECVPHIVAGAGLIALPGLWRDRRRWKGVLLGTTAATGIAFLLILPASSSLLDYFHGQMTTGLRKADTFEEPEHRPGYGIVEGLGEPGAYPSALWGLSGKSWGKRPKVLHQFIAAPLLSVLFGVGLVLLARRGEWGFATLVLLLGAGVVVLLLEYEYAYASYKLLSLMWWVWVLAVLTALVWLLERMPHQYFRAAMAVGLLLFGLRLAADSTWIKRELWPTECAAAPAREFHRLREILPLVGQDRLMIALNDYVPNYWALYHLQPANLYYASPRWCGTWGEHYLPPTAKARLGERSDVRFVLTDRADSAARVERTAGATVVWESRTCQLWELDPECAEPIIVFENQARDGTVSVFVHSPRNGARHRNLRGPLHEGMNRVLLPASSERTAAR